MFFSFSTFGVTINEYILSHNWGYFDIQKNEQEKSVLSGFVIILEDFKKEGYAYLAIYKDNQLYDWKKMTVKESDNHIVLSDMTSYLNLIINLPKGKVFENKSYILECYNSDSDKYFEIKEFKDLESFLLEKMMQDLN